MKIAIAVNGRAHESGVTTYINTIVDPLRRLGHSVDVLSMFGVSTRREVKRKFTERSDTFLSHTGILVLLAYLTSKAILTLQTMRYEIRGRYDVIYAVDISAANVALSLNRNASRRVFLRVGASIPKDLVAQKKLDPSSPLLRYFEREERRAYERVDAVLPNSTWSYQHVDSKDCSAKILPPIVTPVDQEMFKPEAETKEVLKRKAGFDSNSRLILFPSRLDIRKGPHIAIDALRNLHSRSTDYHLLLPGRGTELEEIRSKTMRWGLAKYVHFFGMLTHTEMPDFYNMSDVVIVPSISHQSYEEPLANVVLEAMSCSRPVIASAIGGLRTFITDGENGRLIPEGDYFALAEEIEILANNEGIAMKLALGGLRTVQQSCTPEDAATQLNEIFTSSLHVRSSKPATQPETELA